MAAANAATESKAPLVVKEGHHRRPSLPKPFLNALYLIVASAASELDYCFSAVMYMDISRNNV
jgi:hypothetical protein